MAEQADKGSRSVASGLVSSIACCGSGARNSLGVVEQVHTLVEE